MYLATVLLLSWCCIAVKRQHFYSANFGIVVHANIPGIGHDVINKGWHQHYRSPGKNSLRVILLPDL